MKILLWILALVVLAIVGFGLWVRLAPSDPAAWHVDTPMLDPGAVQPGAGSHAVQVPGAAADLMARLDAIIRATPRTTVLAGDAGAGHVTYVTRSALWGFPDYTTLQAGPDGVTIWGRLRFGGSDLGVNRARIEGWLAALGAG